MREVEAGDCGGSLDPMGLLGEGSSPDRWCSPDVRGTCVWGGTVVAELWSPPPTACGACLNSDSLGFYVALMPKDGMFELKVAESIVLCLQIEDSGRSVETLPRNFHGA